MNEYATSRAGRSVVHASKSEKKQYECGFPTIQGGWYYLPFFFSFSNPWHPESDTWMSELENGERLHHAWEAYRLLRELWPDTRGPQCSTLRVN